MIRHPEPAVSSLLRLSTNPGRACGIPQRPAFDSCWNCTSLLHDRCVHKNRVSCRGCRRSPALSFQTILCRATVRQLVLSTKTHDIVATGSSRRLGSLYGIWHDEVIKSSGFIAPGGPGRAPSTVKDLPPEVLPEVAKVVKECIPYYEALAAIRIRPKTQ